MNAGTNFCQNGMHALFVGRPARKEGCLNMRLVASVPGPFAIVHGGVTVQRAHSLTNEARAKVSM
jgi:hypothetical protein